MRTFSAIITVFAIFIFASCSKSRVLVTENSREPGFSISEMQTKSVTVTGFEPVVVKEYAKNFIAKFPKAKDFATEYTNKFKVKLNSSKLFKTVAVDPSSGWKLTGSGFSAPSDSKMDSLFRSCKTDYMIIMTDFAIANRISTKYTTASSTGTSSTITKEYCLIDARFTVFDVSSRKKVLEFTSRGEQNIYLFGLDNSILKAMDTSVEHAIEYLKTGKKSF